LINFENTRSLWPHHRGDIVVFNEQLHAVAGDSIFLENYNNEWESKGNIFEGLLDYDDDAMESLSDFSSLVVPGKYATSSDILYIYYETYYERYSERHSYKIVLSYDEEAGWKMDEYYMENVWARYNHWTNLLDQNVITYGGDYLSEFSELFSFEVGYSITDRRRFLRGAQTFVQNLAP